jgi:hypothetical protein
MTAAQESSRYSVPLSELEHDVHVPVEDQISELAEPPPPGPFSKQDVDRQLLLGVTGAGRLRLP